MATLTVTNLTFGYDESRPLFRNLSFRLENARSLAIYGPSGCGKSTVLKLIAGLLIPFDGMIEIDGRDLMNVPVHKRGVSLMLQDNYLFPHKNVFENVAFGLKMQKLPKSLIRDRVTELLHAVQMEPFAKRYPNELSGGQKKRIALARAIAVEPAVLMLDEPFTGLDPELRADILQVVKELSKRRNLTTLLVTHDLSEAEALGADVLPMKEFSL